MEYVIKTLFHDTYNCNIIWSSIIHAYETMGLCMSMTIGGEDYYYNIQVGDPYEIYISSMSSNKGCFFFRKPQTQIYLIINIIRSPHYIYNRKQMKHSQSHSSAVTHLTNHLLEKIYYRNLFYIWKLTSYTYM